MMQRVYISFIAVLIAVFAVRAEMDSENRIAVGQLMESLNKLKDAVADRQFVLDSLRQEKNRTPLSLQRMFLEAELGKVYMMQNVDSALMYWHLAASDARALGKPDYETRVMLHVYALLPSIAISHEAIEGLERIDREKLSSEMRAEYFRAAANIYNSTGMHYPPGRYKDKYRLLTLTALDSLDNYFRSDPLYSRYISGFKNSLRGEKSLAVANYLEILPGLTRQERLYDAAAAEVIDYYRNKPDYRQIYLRHLFDLARYYLDHGLIKTEVMAETGRVLIEEGYTELGKRCIRLALETSDMKIGPFRTFDRAEYSRYLTDNADSRSNAMAWLSIALLLLIVVLTVTCVLMYNRIKEISAQDNSAYSTLQARLASTRTMTADCFALMHTAAEQLREYNLLVVRKLTAGQSSSLYADAESGKITRAAAEKFFSELDSTIQKDFPDFTAGLNSLLQPDRQLLPDENGRFTPEMRIAALIHLGITDSSRLAGLLGLSLNTIYTYRNRLKGRALNRETFETDLAEL